MGEPRPVGRTDSDLTQGLCPPLPPEVWDHISTFIRTDWVIRTFRRLSGLHRAIAARLASQAIDPITAPKPIEHYLAKDSILAKLCPQNWQWQSVLSHAFQGTPIDFAVLNLYDRTSKILVFESGKCRSLLLEDVKDRSQKGASFLQPTSVTLCPKLKSWLKFKPLLYCSSASLPLSMLTFDKSRRRLQGGITVTLRPLEGRGCLQHRWVQAKEVFQASTHESWAVSIAHPQYGSGSLIRLWDFSNSRSITAETYHQFNLNQHLSPTSPGCWIHHNRANPPLFVGGYQSTKFGGVLLWMSFADQSVKGLVFGHGKTVEGVKQAPYGLLVRYCDADSGKLIVLPYQSLVRPEPDCRKRVVWLQRPCPQSALPLKRSTPTQQPSLRRITSSVTVDQAVCSLIYNHDAAVKPGSQPTTSYTIRQIDSGICRQMFTKIPQQTDDNASVHTQYRWGWWNKKPALLRLGYHFNRGEIRFKLAAWNLQSNSTHVPAAQIRKDAVYSSFKQVGFVGELVRYDPKAHDQTTSRLDVPTCRLPRPISAFLSRTPQSERRPLENISNTTPPPKRRRVQEKW